MWPDFHTGGGSGSLTGPPGCPVGPSNLSHPAEPLLSEEHSPHQVPARITPSAAPLHSHGPVRALGALVLSVHLASWVGGQPALHTKEASGPIKPQTPTSRGPEHSRAGEPGMLCSHLVQTLWERHALHL